MRSRFVCVFRNCVPVLAVMLLLTSLAVSSSNNNRALLGSNDLSRSRGNNILLVLGQLNCNTLQGNPACVLVNAACKTCSVASVTQTKAGTNGGYNAGIAGGGSCGFIDNGTCNAAFTCVFGAATLVGCAAPPGPVSVQP